MKRPDGYPYTTVRPCQDTWNAVEVDWHANGYEQTTWVGPSEPDYLDAKRAALSRARSEGCNFRVAIQ